MSMSSAGSAMDSGRAEAPMNALDALAYVIERRKVNYVVDAEHSQIL